MGKRVISFACYSNLIYKYIHKEMLTIDKIPLNWATWILGPIVGFTHMFWYEILGNFYMKEKSKTANIRVIHKDM